MGTSARLIKNWDTHNPEKVIADLVKVAFRIGAIFTYNNDINYSESGEPTYVTLNLADDISSVKPGNSKSLLIYLKFKKKKYINNHEFDWIDSHLNLETLGIIDRVKDENFDLVSRFIYEYLKLNPDEYFWLEGDWAYSWADLKKLSEEQLKEGWLFKNPENF